MIESEVSGPFDRLSLALAIEDDECSTAAATLNKEVLDLFSEDNIQRGNLLKRPLSIVGVGKEGSSKEYLTRRITRLSTGYNSNTIPIVFVQQIGARGSKVEEPLLVAMLDNEIALPLASFQKREHGKCSYVQIGSEMTKDNLFVITKDESTQRAEIIKAIRTLYSIEYNHIYPSDVIKSMRALIEQEANSHRDEILRRKEASLVKKASEYLEGSYTEEREIVIISEEGEWQDRKVVEKATLFAGYKLGDGRVVKITIGRQANKDSNIVQLFAISRGNIAIPIVTFDKSTGTVDFAGAEETISNNDKVSIMNLLLNRMEFIDLGLKSNKYGVNVERTYPYRGKLKYFSINYRNSKEIRSKEIKRLTFISSILERGGLLRKSEVHLPGGQKIPSDTRIQVPKRMKSFMKSFGEPTPGLISTLERFFDNTIVDRYVGIVNTPRSKPNDENYCGNRLTVAKERMDNPSSMHKNLFTLLKIEKRFNDLLGQTSTEEEELLSLLSYLTEDGEKFSGVIPDIKIGITHTKAVIEARIIREGTIYNILINGKVQAVAGVNKHLLDFQFDASKPLFDHSSKDTAKKNKDLKTVLKTLTLGDHSSKDTVKNEPDNLLTDKIKMENIKKARVIEALGILKHLDVLAPRNNMFYNNIY
jgi:hypothetical protein